MPDQLNVLQAHYSNERTFLSYIRTSTSVLVLAVALMRFFDNKAVIFLGWFTLAIGIVILAVGLKRYMAEKNRIRDPDLKSS
jgi:putative membrane protein